MEELGLADSSFGVNSFGRKKEKSKRSRYCWKSAGIEGASGERYAHKVDSRVRDDRSKQRKRMKVRNETK